jgi:hypothetical protein
MKPKNITFWDANRGRVIFPTGEINPNGCTLADFQPIVGDATWTESGERQNHIIFFHDFGQLNLVFHPDASVSEQTRVAEFWIELPRDIPLAHFLQIYGQEPKTMFIEFVDQTVPTMYLAIFSPNFGVQFNPQTEMVNAIMFGDISHIKNCSCQVCTFIRKEFQMDA